MLLSLSSVYYLNQTWSLWHIMKHQKMSAKSCTLILREGHKISRLRHMKRKFQNSNVNNFYTKWGTSFIHALYQVNHNEIYYLKLYKDIFCIYKIDNNVYFRLIVNCYALGLINLKIKMFYDGKSSALAVKILDIRRYIIRVYFIHS